MTSKQKLGLERVVIVSLLPLAHFLPVLGPKELLKFTLAAEAPVFPGL